MHQSNKHALGKSFSKKEISLFNAKCIFWLKIRYIKILCTLLLNLKMSFVFITRNTQYTVYFPHPSLIDDFDSTYHIINYFSHLSCVNIFSIKVTLFFRIFVRFYKNLFYTIYYHHIL